MLAASPDLFNLTLMQVAKKCACETSSLGHMALRYQAGLKTQKAMFEALTEIAM